MNLDFDRKFGRAYLDTVPHLSGVYIFRDENSEAVYVGKAKNLYRRLSQYRLAPGRKPYRKMRTIVRASATLEYQICASEKEALLLENQLILKHKPSLNIAGAYSFLYPYLGLKGDTERPHLLTLCYTTSPSVLTGLGFDLFGAFRSRDATSGAYDALAFLLSFLGHHTPSERQQYGDLPYTRIIAFRQMPAGWAADLRSLFRGESKHGLERLVMDLLEKPDARQSGADIQLHLKCLKYFFQREAANLRSALMRLGIEASMIPQEERDRVFLTIAEPSFIR